MPIIFNDEIDKIEVLSLSAIDTTDISKTEVLKHNLFVDKLIHEKKTMLVEKYFSMALEIKQAQTFEQIQRVEYQLTYIGKYLI